MEDSLLSCAQRSDPDAMNAVQSGYRSELAQVRNIPYQQNISSHPTLTRDARAKMTGLATATNPTHQHSPAITHSALLVTAGTRGMDGTSAVWIRSSN
jgi:hypothetical protein